jgi:hypothetical protein
MTATLWIIVAIAAGMFFGRPIVKCIGVVIGFVFNLGLILFMTALRLTLRAR